MYFTPPSSPLHFQKIVKVGACLCFCSPCPGYKFQLLLYFVVYCCYLCGRSLIRGKQFRYGRASRELKGDVAATCFFQVWLLFWKVLLICLTSVCTGQIWDLLYCLETNFHFAHPSDSLYWYGQLYVDLAGFCCGYC